MPAPTAPHPALALSLFGLAAAILLAGVHHLTRDRIANERERQTRAVLHQVIDPDSYNNDLAADRIQIHLPGLAQPATLYRARRDGEPVAAIYDLITPHGYSGPIRLLAGVDIDGRITSVRVLEHRETPGLGDVIETRRSNWILGFDGRNLANPPPEAWSVRQRGGALDGISGATITVQAVTIAVRTVLQHFEAERDQVFDSPAHIEE